MKRPPHGSGFVLATGIMIPVWIVFFILIGVL